MLQALIGPVSGLIGSWMDKKTEEQRGKSAVAKARAEAEAAVMVGLVVEQLRHHQRSRCLL